jgi:hypothetical protein
MTFLGIKDNLTGHYFISAILRVAQEVEDKFSGKQGHFVYSKNSWYVWDSMGFTSIFEVKDYANLRLDQILEELAV